MKMLWGFAQQGEKFFLENSTPETLKANGRPYPPFSILAHIGMKVERPEEARDIIQTYINRGVAGFRG